MEQHTTKRTLTLEREQPLSWNDMQAGEHWKDRSVEARKCKMAVRAALDPDWPMFRRPVNIALTAFCKSRPIDSPNIYSKPYIDGLIGWLIADDGPQYVRTVSTTTCIDKDNPRLVIEVEEIGADEPDTLPGLMFSCTCGRKYKQLAQLLEHRERGECGGRDGVGWEG